MASLRELQELLARALRSERAVADDPALAAAASMVVRGNARLTSVEQVEIYREQFFRRHVECLADDYPVLLAALGAGAFEALARGFLAAHPPASFSLRDLGERLPAFVATAGLEHPALFADLARLEWAFVAAFDAADASRLDVAKLAEMGDAVADARVTPCPSMQLVEARYPVHALRSAVLADAAPPVMAPAPTFLVVFRPDLEPTCEAVPRLAFLTLARLGAGMALGAALDDVASGATDEETASLEASIGGWLHAWATSGLLRDLDPAEGSAPSALPRLV